MKSMEDKTMHHLVSVIIPNYNGSEFIRQCLESVFAQDYRHIEIIVVDDGSKDSSLEILSSFLGRIKIISQQNLGSSAARNTGILASSGDLIAFLDSDDYWLPTKISKQVAEMEATSSDLIYCHGKEFGINGESALHKAKLKGYCYDQYKKSPAKSIVELACSTALIKKSLLARTGLFDSDFRGPAEDWDFFRRYCREAFIGYCDEVLVMYRRHSNNLSSASLDHYFAGNKLAITKLFASDNQMGIIERRRVWFDFCFSFAKSYLKQRRPVKVLEIFFLAILPIKA